MDFNEMSMKYVVRIDDKGHHFSLYSKEAIKTFNNIVFPNRGSNVEVASGGAFGGLTAPTSVTAASAMTEGSYDITTDGSAFSFSESFTYGDAVNPMGTGVDVSSGIVADMPAYGVVQTNSGGVAGTLAGTISSAGAIALTAGGAGTNATGQFVSEITIK